MRKLLAGSLILLLIVSVLALQAGIIGCAAALDPAHLKLCGWLAAGGACGSILFGSALRKLVLSAP